MTLEQGAQYATIASAVGTMVFNAIMARILWQTNKLTKISKQNDMLAHFNTRYDLLMSTRNVGTSQKADSKHYWARFWSLQFDQFTSWRAGFVSPAIFDYWTISRDDDYENNEITNNSTYTDAWNKAKTNFGAHPDFDKFMELVHRREFKRAYKLVNMTYRR